MAAFLEWQGGGGSARTRASARARVAFGALLFALTSACSDDPPVNAAPGGAPSTGGSSGSSGAGGAGAGSPGAGGNNGLSANERWQSCGVIPGTEGAVPVFVSKGDSVVIWPVRGPALLRPLDRSLPARELPAGTSAVSPDAELLVTNVDSMVIRRMSDFSVLSEIAAADVLSCPSPTRFSTSNDVLITHGTNAWCAFDTATGARLLEVLVGSSAAAVDGGDLVVLASDYDRPAPPFGLLRYALDGGASTRLELDILPTSGDLVDRFVTLAPNGATAASVATSKDMQSCTLWDTRTGSKLWSMDGPVATIDATVRRTEGVGGSAPGFSPDGRFTTLCRVVVDTQMLVQSEDLGAEYESELSGASLAPDGKRAAFGISGLGTALPVLMDFETFQLEALSGHTVRDYPLGIKSLSLSRDGAMLASTSCEVLVLRVADKFEQSVATRYRGAPEQPSVELSPDGRWLSVFGDGRRLYDLSDSRRPNPFDDLAELASLPPCWPQARFSPDGRWLAGVTFFPELDLFRIEDFLPPAGAVPSVTSPAVSMPLASCAEVAFSADGQRLVTSDLGSYTLDGDVVSAGDPTRSNPDDAPENMSNRIEASRDGRWLVTSRCKYGTCVTTLRTANGELVRRLEQLTAPFPSFSVDGNWLAAGNQLLHIDSGLVVPLDGKVQVSIFAPNGDIYAGTDDFSLVRYCRVRP